MKRHPPLKVKEKNGRLCFLRIIYEKFVYLFCASMSNLKPISCVTMYDYLFIFSLIFFIKHL